MNKQCDIHIFDRLEIHHLEAYYRVGTRTAQKRKKSLLEDANKKPTGVLFFWDLADYEGYENEADKLRFLEAMKRVLEPKPKKE